MALVSRRALSAAGGAGVDCSACQIRAQRQSMAPGVVRWVCPKCAAHAPACDSTFDHRACVLLGGHDGNHELADGAIWAQEPPPPVVPALRRAVAHPEAPAPTHVMHLVGLGEQIEAIAESLKVSDLVSPAWLRAVARYLRQRAAEGDESGRLRTALKFERVAAEVESCLSFVEQLDRQEPDAADAIAALVAPKADKRPTYQAPADGEW